MTLPLPPSDARRIVFLGTPGIAVPTLAAIHHAGFEIPLVVTGRDKRRGRGGNTSPSPVKDAALELGLTVSHEMIDAIEVEADLGVVVAFGQLISAKILEQLPMVNLHVSALPRWRGAAPIERAILAGDETTAVTIMSIVEALDEGDIWAQESVTIGPDETADQLRERLGAVGADLMVETIVAGFPTSVPQVGAPVYAAKIKSSDLMLDWTRPAVDLHRIVRVGGAWTTFRGERFKIWDAHAVSSSSPPGSIDGLTVGAGAGGLQLISVQPAGKPRMAADGWANGARPEAHEQLGVASDG